MIKIDKSSTKLEGDNGTLLAELTYAVYHVVDKICKETGVSVTEVDNDLQTALQLTRLVESGMDWKDAYEVVYGKELKL